MTDWSLKTLKAYLSMTIFCATEEETKQRCSKSIIKNHTKNLKRVTELKVHCQYKDQDVGEMPVLIYSLSCIEF